MATYLIIFGAAIRSDGSPSGSMARRVEGAFAFSRTRPDCKFVVTGGVGRHGPAEAELMRDLLIARGVDRDDILVEDRARDTLESVEFCHALLDKRADVDAVVPCTSSYHVPRCELLLRLLGYQTVVIAMPPDRPNLPIRKWLYFVIKEFVSLPYDVVLLLLRRRTMNRVRRRA